MRAASTRAPCPHHAPPRQGRRVSPCLGTRVSIQSPAAVRVGFGRAQSRGCGAADWATVSALDAAFRGDRCAGRGKTAWRLVERWLQSAPAAVGEIETCQPGANDAKGHCDGKLLYAVGDLKICFGVAIHEDRKFDARPGRGVCGRSACSGARRRGFCSIPVAHSGSKQRPRGATSSELARRWRRANSGTNAESRSTGRIDGDDSCICR